ncbi:type II toxin-antitoxin system RelE/ParE family toxin [Candidatus Paracaedibacter symbiosus]|uniref:type II toxin-antitoxin system RelE/ParE family toxin n=1 Tax=Candidatus Paracaedibacter symbiosus TaxID=244582 RepID=UPI00050983BB|nr:type II toxin-antitoxin system RelE/ParE family toxin [Candidatus Paracaedibacter symbiosus]
MSIEDKKLIAIFFKASSGREPVREWLKDLVSGNRKIVGADIKTVEFGWPIGMPVCRPLGNGLYEVRSNLLDKSIARVIFCIERNTMVLLHGFIKKIQKTPQKEPSLALDRKKELYK